MLLYIYIQISTSCNTVFVLRNIFLLLLLQKLIFINFTMLAAIYDHVLLPGFTKNPIYSEGFTKN